MKVGMIFECGPNGADKQVCEYLAKKTRPGLVIESVTLDNKPKLVEGCGNAAAQLLNDGCVRVVIVWDLYPPWRDYAPCRREDRVAILKSLSDAGVTSPHVHLVCISEELEAWLIADKRALESVLSRPTHAVRVPDTKHPERKENPKAYLNNLFQTHTGKGYNELFHAKKIVASPDLNKLGRCPSFARFTAKLQG